MPTNKSLKGELLFSEKGEFQTIEVIQSSLNGRILLINDRPILSERDEHIQAEMLAHPPLFLLNNPRMVLVLGGGTGATSREILRHPSIETCVVIEKDETVTHACSELIPQTTAHLKSLKVKLVYQDEIEWIKNAANEGLNKVLGKGFLATDQFDLICVERIFAEKISAAARAELFAGIKILLSSTGIVVASAGSPFYDEKEQATIASDLKKSFKNLYFYNYTNRTALGGLSSIAFASNSVHPLDSLKIDRYTAAGMSFKYYNFGIHEGSFLLPEFQKQFLKEWLSNL